MCDDSLRSTTANRIDPICLEFEARLQRGEAPAIDDYVERADAADRAVLREELVRIERAYGERHAAGTVDPQSSKNEPTELTSDAPRAGEPSPGAMNCPRCATALSLEGVRDGSVVLCAACRLAFVVRPLADKRKTCRKAIVSLVLGFCTMLFACLAGMPAIVFGAMALYEISRNKEQLKGELLAVGGIAMGVLCNFLCMPVVWGFLLSAIGKLRAQ